MALIQIIPPFHSIYLFIDSPLKRFAQRYTYHSIDAIAGHDLGFAKTKLQAAALKAAPLSGGPSQNVKKRPLSPPDLANYKRVRPSSPSQHSREPDHPPPAPLLEKEGKPIQLPHALHSFVSQPPPCESFDGAFSSCSLPSRSFAERRR